MTPLRTGDHDTLPEHLGDALREALDAALAGDDLPHAGAPPLRVRCAGRGRGGRRAEADVDVRALGPLGAQVERVRVRSEGGRDLAREAAALPRRVDRLLPEPIAPLEVAPTLGKAVLRTPLDHMRGRRFFDVELDADGDAELRRVRVTPDGDREPEPFTLTREQLRGLVDALAAPCTPADSRPSNDGGGPDIPGRSS